MSDKAVLNELGARIQALRLNVNMTQSDVARKAGISRRTLQDLEGGRGCALALLVRTLRAIGRVEQFNAFLPEPGISPLQMAKLKGRERKRATGSRLTGKE